jgi:hypothetical protein
VVPLLIKLILAPGLMAAATVAERRWGPRRGGVVSAFPAIVGSLFLVTLIEHGAPAAARAASGTLLGLAGLAAFIAAYGRSAGRRSWPVSLALGWAAAALVTGLSALWGSGGWLINALIACGALLVSLRLLEPARDLPAPPPGGPVRSSLLLRAGVTALLVTGLAGAVGAFGATIGGLLAGLPVLASLLAIFTHREAGGAAAIEILRGTIVGMTGFVAFCVIVAAAIVSVGGAAAFAGATVAALLLQILLTRLGGAYPSARKSAGRSGEASASARLRASASRSAA